MSDGALVRRIEAAIYATSVSRAAVNEDWPKCHKKGCQGRHATPDFAFQTMLASVAESVKLELNYRITTRPDVSDRDTDDNPEALAVFTLATLLHTYAVGADTYVKAARLIVEAYPAIIPVFSNREG